MQASSTAPIAAPPIVFIGRATLDVVYSMEHFPAQDTKIFARAMQIAPGGPATNAAITHALLGGTTLLMAALGTGPWAAQVGEELGRLGIGVIDVAAGTTYETPVTTVLVNEPGGTRTIVNPPMSEIALKRIDAWDSAWGAMPNLVLTDGFHLRETLPLLRKCRQAGAQVCLDGGSWKTGTEELAGVLTAAICSERFAVPGKSADSDSVIEWFAGKGVPSIAITRGPRPILASDRGQRFEIEVENIQAVDTLGAGDVLHGAFCYYFAKTGDFPQALRLAAQLATRSCRGSGIRCWAES